MAETVKTKITKETYLQWYEMMQLIRLFENRAAQMYGMQKIRGFLHLYIGQEAVAAGSVSATHPDDPFVTAYRDHGLAIAKGMSVEKAMAELFGKITGCSKGKGGSMHFFDREHHFYGGHAIVGGQIPIGAGIAFAEKYRQSGKVCLCFFGDGAVHQGALHETFNMAKLWNLPVVFICENNHYAMGTAVERASSIVEFYRLGEVYGIPSAPVDGMSCEAVHEAVYEAAEYARSGQGPYFLEIKTYRYKGHSMSDPAKYRTREEVEEYMKHDPIEKVRKTILEKGYATEDRIKEIVKTVKEKIDKAVEFSENSPFPEADELYKDVYMQADYPFLKD